MRAINKATTPASVLGNWIARYRPPRYTTYLSTRYHQRRWAQVHDVRFLATTQAPRHVLERYREKLDRKARDEGHADTEALREAYADKIQHQRRRDAVAVPGLDRVLGPERAPPQPQQQQPQRIQSAAAGETTEKQRSRAVNNRSASSQVKPLSAILDLPKARKLPVAELSAVWRLRHASSPQSLCAVVPASTYAAMEALARHRPQFVLPVPHPDQGAEIHFLQWTFDAATSTSTVLFTHLAEYKARGEFAQPHTTVTHHSDLAAESGVVLMHGTVVENRGVKLSDAHFLVVCLQRFYGGWDGASDAAAAAVDGGAAERRRLVEWFSTGDERFSVQKLLDETEKLG